MKRKVFKILLSIILLLGLAVNSMAEPPEDFDRPPSKEQMEKIRKRVETLKMWRLTEALNLDEKTSAQVFPILNRFDKKRYELEESLREGMRELRESLRNKKEDQLKKIVNKLEQDHKALQSLKQEEWAEMKKVLTIEQQAKFIIFLTEFEREVRKLIAEARERRGERFGKDGQNKLLPPERQ